MLHAVVGDTIRMKIQLLDDAWAREGVQLLAEDHSTWSFVDLEEKQVYLRVKQPDKSIQDIGCSVVDASSGIVFGTINFDQEGRYLMDLVIRKGSLKQTVFAQESIFVRRALPN
ncbi:hypothetical protein ACQZV8_11900 [Magnetococcales bacterium HHB-1]